ncbi:MAG: hypothetical protein ABR591_05615 [Candidatus Velthaea sp.]
MFGRTAVAVLAALLVAPGRADAVHHAAATPTPKCPDAIPVAMEDTVSSASSRADEYFRFRTMQDEHFGKLVIPKGVWGYGVLRGVSPAGHRNQYGSVTLEPRYLALGPGKRIEVTMDPALPVSLTTRTPSVEQAASHVPIPLPGLAMSALNMVRMGKNVTIGHGYTFAVIPLFDPTHNPGC